MKNELKFVKEEAAKVKIMTDLRIHKIRAKQFNLLMKADEENSLAFCFDLQQLQPLPKLPIGEAYYASQISFYALSITDINTRNPIFYTWTENLSVRGPNEVRSALLQFLKNYNYPDDCKKIKLFADGCAGQNKNNFVIHGLMKILNDKIKEITVTFPVRGHSFMPADRVFGRTEKLFRKQEEIITKEDYYKLYEEVGPVLKMGDDWKVYDFKKLSTNLKRITGISQAKRFHILKKNIKNNKTYIVIKSELLYRNDDSTKKFETLLKRGKTMDNIQLKKPPLSRKLKPDKVKSVITLLDPSDVHWKENFEKYKWYQQVLLEDNAEGTK